LQSGFVVKIVDGCLDGKKGVINALQEFYPDFVGITCLTPARKNAIEVARLSKEFDARISVVMGGAHPTIMYRQLLNHYPEIDIVVMGEGEQALREIAQGHSLEEIQGIAFRDAEGEVVRNPLRKYIQNLDELPFPAWHLLELHRYKGWGEGTHNGIVLRDHPRISVIFSRGCSGHCDFCSTWWIWKGWRHRSGANMVDELELLYHNFGIRHFCFADDALTIDRQATLDLCDEIIARKLKIAFIANTRTDCVDEEILLKLKNAGCYMIAFGIETGSPQILKNMRKENEIENSEKAITLCKKVGLPVTALMIVGNVGETEETVRETLALLKKTMPDEVACTGSLWVLPGTKLYQDCRRKGIIDDDFWLGDEPYLIYTMEHSQETLDSFVKIINNYKGPLRRSYEKIKRLPKLFKKIKSLFI